MKRALVLLLFMCSYSYAQTEKECLANSIFYEAGGEPLVGQKATETVILNRAKAHHKSICKVVLSPHQFSWSDSKPIKPLNKHLKMILVNIQKKPSILDEHFMYFYSGKKPKWAIGAECVKISHQVYCKRVNYKEK